MRELQRVVIVEDDEDLREALAGIVTGWGMAVSSVATAAAARLLLAEEPAPDLLIIDVRLPDDTAFGVLDVASELSPAPVMVAMSGKASPEEAFQLAQKGVRVYLAKPFSVSELANAVETASDNAPGLGPWVSALVGQVPLRELQKEVRRVMVTEALARTEGSRSGAARLLQVTRQAVQQMVRDEGLSEESPEPQKTAG